MPTLGTYGGRRCWPSMRLRSSLVVVVGRRGRVPIVAIGIADSAVSVLSFTNGRRYIRTYVHPWSNVHGREGTTTSTTRGTRGTRVRRKQLNLVLLSLSLALLAVLVRVASSFPSLFLFLRSYPRLVSSSPAWQRSLISTATYIPFPVR